MRRACSVPAPTPKPSCCCCSTPSNAGLHQRGAGTSWFNATSRTAIARLGAKQDGVLRNHKRHADGTPRDTVIFSIIDAEWQGVKRHLQYRLDSYA